jgi:hypothetical protein
MIGRFYRVCVSNISQSADNFPQVSFCSRRFQFGPNVDLQRLNNNFMGGLLYTIAVILVIAWAIGFLGYHSGGLIHLLLVIAIIAVILGVIRRA